MGHKKGTGIMNLSRFIIRSRLSITIVLTVLLLGLTIIKNVNNSHQISVLNELSVDEYDYIDMQDEESMLSNWNITQYPVRGDNHILFIESSCAVNEKNVNNNQLVLTPRQACAIESAAKQNPESQIYLFYTCPLDANSLRRSQKFVRRLFELKNLKVWHESMASFYKNTPLEEFYESGVLKKSIFPREHASDIMRVLMLWKYGGTYLDLDFIVKRSLAPLGTNYACAEDEMVANGVLSFSADGLGEKVANMLVEDIRINYSWYRWTYNGPGSVTRVMKDLCKVEELGRMTKEACQGFVLHPPATFIPIHFNDWRLLYDIVKSESTMKHLQYSYAVHLYNSMQTSKATVFIWGGDELIPGSKQPTVLLQQEFCPDAYLATSHQAKTTNRN